MSSSNLPQDRQGRSLTVVQVVPRLHVGGVERGTVELAIHLKKTGHQPVVISAGGQLVEELLAHGVQHISLDVASKSPLLWWQAAKLRQILNRLNADVVHARSRIPAWICHLAIRRMPRKPAFVTTLHGLHSVSRYSAIMASSDQVIAVSETAKNYLLTHYADRLKADPVVIYRGVSEAFNRGQQRSADWLTEWQQKHPDIQSRRKVLLPGRLTRVKGFEHLMPWLRQAPDDVVLLVTAQPHDSGHCRQLAAMLNKAQLQHKVCWLGIQRDMPALYQSVDLVVSVNNKAESFGRTVLEALTMGVPVVAFALGGVAEVMNRLFPEGLVAAGDDQALSERINQFLAEPPEVPAHQVFSNQSMFSETVQVYQQLLERRHD
jgi:glycosyltransferase involved in cell wall biosynthesis